MATVNQKVDRVPGIGLLVQSPDASLVRLGEEIDNFLLNFLDKLKAMTKEDFDKQRKAVLFKLQEKPKNLSEHLSRYWESIITLNYSFDRREKLIAAIQKISHQDILDIFYPLMIKSGYSFQIDSGNIFSFDKKQFEENREIFTFSTEDR